MAANDESVTGWDDLFNLKGNSPIPAAIKDIQALESAYTSFMTVVKSQNKTLSTELDGVRDEAGKLLTSINQMNNAASKSAEAYTEVAKGVEELTTTQQNLKTQLDQNTKALDSATKQVDALAESRQKLTQAALAESGSLDEIKDKLNAAVKNYKSLGDSVDQSIKDSAIQQVANLSKQYNNVNTALTNAKKSVTVASGSYNDLKKNVAAATMQLKGMQGSLTANSTEVQALKKFIADGTEQLNTFDASIGKNQGSLNEFAGSFKNLKVELKEAKDALVAIASEFGEDSDEFKKAAVNAGEIADKLHDVQEVVNTTSGEPIERFTKSFGLLKDKLLSLDFRGANLAIKQIAAASSDLTFKDALKGVGSFTTSLGQLGKAILTNPLFLIVGTIALITVALVKLADKVRPIQQLFEAAGQAIQAVTDTVKEFSDALGLTAFQAEEYADRVIKAYDKAQAKVSEYYDNEIAVASAAGANTQLLELQKQKLLNITSQAQIKALDDYRNQSSKFSQFLSGFLLASFGVYTSAQNKLSDEQQAAYDKAKKTLQDSNASIKEIEIKNYKERLQLTDQFVDERVADAYDLAKSLNQIAQNEQQRIISNENNAYASRAAAAVALTNLQIAQAKADAKQQEATLQIALRTLQERKDAEIRLTQDRTVAIKKALEQSQRDELILAGANKAKRNEINARYDELAKQATLSVDDQIKDINQRFGQEELGTRQHIATETAKIEAEKNEKIKQLNLALKALNTQFIMDDINQQIQHNQIILENDLNNFDDRVNALKANLDLQEQIIDAEKQKAVLLATSNGEDLDKVNQKFADQRKAAEYKLTQDIISIYTARYEKLAAIEQGKKGINSDQALLELNDSLANREISLVQYNYKKAQLEKAANIQQLQEQIKSYQQLSDLQKSFGYDTTALDKQIADAQVQISEAETATIIQNRQKLNDALNNLGQAALNTTQTLVNAALQSNIDGLNAQLAAEQAKHDQSAALVQNDAQAKAIIDQNFANKQVQIQRQIGQEKRKQAIADKARSVASIIIDTARGVAAALPIIPLAVAVGAIGALELATVIATPIPAFKEGTKFSPEGHALVAEAGPELVIDPSGKGTLFTKPAMPYLKRGSEVKTAEETESLMETAKRFGDHYMFDQNRSVYDGFAEALAMSDSRNAFEQAALIQEMQMTRNSIVDAIQSKEENHWDEIGYRRFQRTQNAKIESLNRKYRLG